MALGPRLDLRQSQSLVMTPQLQQAIKLLALSNLEIEAFIGEALDANPLLDIAAPDAADPTPEALPEEQRRTTLESSAVDQLIGEGRAESDQPLDIDPTLIDRDIDPGDVPARNVDAGEWGAALDGAFNPDQTFPERSSDEEQTLARHLEEQLGLATGDVGLRATASYIIGLLDEAGYLSASLAEIAADLGVDLAQAKAALSLVQSLEPPGVGARDLAECLCLQAKAADRYDPIMARFLDNLDLVARGEFARLKRLCRVDDEDLADMLAELRGYDPRPGTRFAPGTSEAVTPDILITERAATKEKEAGWDIQLNQATLPRLIVNRSYYLELKTGCTDKDAKGWLSEKLTDANWLIKALDQRQRTILKVAAELVKQQDGFFRHGVRQLRPLTLRTVAEAIEMHESTVSRVTANKYLHCARGTFELKYFFTSGVGQTDGEGGASAEAVKAAIRQLIDAEDAKAILSDDTLVDMLKERGFDLARRTVAKYREAIGLGSSVQRRRLKALAGVR